MSKQSRQPWPAELQKKQPSTLSSQLSAVSLAVVVVVVEVVVVSATSQVRPRRAVPVFWNPGGQVDTHMP